MSTSKSTPSPVPAGDDPNSAPSADVPVAGPTFEDKITLFWKNNRKPILGLCIAILLVISAKGLWEVYQDHRQHEIMDDYARTSGADGLKKFAAEHDGDPLAGVANLRLADEAFAGGKAGEAVPLYAKAAAILKTGPLAGRAALGNAVAKTVSGDRTGGEAALKAVASDLSQVPAIRAEATYHLATLAADAGDETVMQKYLEQITAISPESTWAERASVLRIRKQMPASPAPEASGKAAPASGPTISFPTKGK